MTAPALERWRRPLARVSVVCLVLTPVGLVLPAWRPVAEGLGLTSFWSVSGMAFNSSLVLSAVGFGASFAARGRRRMALLVLNGLLFWVWLGLLIATYVASIGMGLM